ncbi:hypothetical protein M0805_000333 [Coniferiporia weirii]|nr:hypothetical protein M0805_000333 [Coniferiporia weirii]
MAAVYSSNVFRENSLEDVVFIAIHVYLLFVAVYAIARESIPHIITIFGMHCLSLILSQLVKAAGCGTDFFGTTFYTDRHIYEGCLLIVSVLSIIVEAFAACKLGRVYSTRPWRVVQVSGPIRKMYRLLLGFSVVIQIAGLLLPAIMALWVYQLKNTWFSQIVGRRHVLIYEVFFIFVTIGWYSLRREWPRATLVFLVLGFIILCCCIAGFGSAMFLWAFTTWWFFGALYTLALTFVCAALVLALFCRRNFGNNLDHYLIVQNRLSAMGFAHGHFEKDDKLDETRISSDTDKGGDI